jgi:acyl dehydratase
VTAALFYEDLERGQRFTEIPSLTIGDGLAEAHRAILGHRLPLSLDRGLARRVTGSATRLVHPSLVCDIAIGQSTVATQRVIANLFYRGLRAKRAVAVGDTLATEVEVVALRDVSPKPGRSPAGLAALRVETTDQDGRPVLEFFRCAMLPLAPGAAPPGHTDDLDRVGPTQLDDDWLHAARGWDVDAHPFRDQPLAAGQTLKPAFGDTVSAAPELARLSLNIAGAHHDPRAGIDGRRLVYGGHAIGLAAAQLSRVLPGLVYILGWKSCTHAAPVFEGDVLESEIRVLSVEPAGAGRLVELAVRVESVAETPTTVLDWQLVGLVA